MTDTQATILAIAAGLALALVLGASLRRRLRPQPVFVPMPSDSWSDEEIDRMLDALEDGDRPTVYLTDDDLRDEHEGAFV